MPGIVFSSLDLLVQQSVRFEEKSLSYIKYRKKKFFGYLFQKVYTISDINKSYTSPENTNFDWIHRR
jgi:hypothetical protein